MILVVGWEFQKVEDKVTREVVNWAAVRNQPMEKGTKDEYKKSQRDTGYQLLKELKRVNSAAHGTIEWTIFQQSL